MDTQQVAAAAMSQVSALKRKREEEEEEDDDVKEFCPHLKHVRTCIMKDQQYTKACNASATCMAVSINYAIENPTEPPIDLSHQYVFDNLSKEHGTLADAYKVFLNKGVVEEECCKFVGFRREKFEEPEGRRMYIKTYDEFERPDEAGPEIERVRKHLETGVLTATMVISQRIKEYKSKGLIVRKEGDKLIREDDLPGGVPLSHAVVIFGHGIDKKTGVHYYRVKNPWGLTWGEQGCAKVASYYFFHFGKSISPSFQKNQASSLASSGLTSASQNDALDIISAVYSDDALKAIATIYSDEEI